MQLSKSGKKFDSKRVEQFLRDENKFITNLLTISGVPDRRINEEEEDNEDTQTPQTHSLPSTKKSRAKSLSELEDRLKAITSKKRLTFKEKLARKGLKNRLKKKNKQDVRNAKQKLERAAKLMEKPKPAEVETAEKKPVFNTDNKMVFSKIDFANVGRKKHKKQEKDPEKILLKLNEEKTRLEELEKSGDISKVIQIKEKAAWKSALAKVEGQKVKDDPLLLKKSVQKKEQKVKSSKKKWQARIEGVEKAKADRQHKRTENIQKRKKDKKLKNLKNASKRGKIIPGF